jgi:hypothetical protein
VKQSFYVLIIVYITFSLTGCLSFSNNDIIKKEISPNGKYIAYAFIRNGGATTSYSPQVTILKNNQDLSNKTGNVFIGYRSKFINIYWKDNETLIIEHSCTDDLIFKSLDIYNNVKIEYIVNSDTELFDTHPAP